MYFYLKAYGCDYDFLQFYIQSDDINFAPTSVIMRYNSIIYVTSLMLSDEDINELTSFLYGFNDCEIISGVNLPDLTRYKIIDECFIMSYKSFEREYSPNENIRSCTDSKVISDLVMKDETQAKYMDFYLNNSHLLRHGFLKSFIMYSDDIPVSVITVSDTDFRINVIPTVYTNKYFRGNGYSKSLLTTCLSQMGGEYQLLCEEKNISFYRKCGFEAIGQWFYYKIRG